MAAAILPLLVMMTVSVAAAPAASAEDIASYRYGADDGGPVTMNWCLYGDNTACTLGLIGPSLFSVSNVFDTWGPDGARPLTFRLGANNRANPRVYLATFTPHADRSPTWALRFPSGSGCPGNVCVEEHFGDAGYGDQGFIGNWCNWGFRSGSASLGIFRASTGTWYLRGDGGQVAAFRFGSPGDIAVPQDIDGNGCTDLGIFRPSTGQWFLGSRGDRPVVFGAPGDVPVVGDWNGDGRDDIAVARSVVLAGGERGGSAVFKRVTAFVPASGAVDISAGYEALGSADVAEPIGLRGGANVAAFVAGSFPRP